MKRFLSGLLKVYPLLLFGILFMPSCSTSSFFYITQYNSPDLPDTTLCKYEDVYFKSADGMTLHGWFIKPRSGPVRGTILHFHGNAGNIGYYVPYLLPLVQAGFQGLLWDYEQYGTSQGAASQEHVLEDGIAALDYVRSRPDVNGTSLILFGQSLGGHLAVVVAAREQKKIDGLIVEGAFSSHHQIAQYHAWRRYLAPPLLTYFVVPSKYSALDVVDRIEVPKLFIHSTEDKTCPFFMGKRLYDKAIAPKEFWEIKGRHCRAGILYKDEFVEHFIQMANCCQVARAVKE
ncbi:MAG TPA: alpha/beta hydrolase [Bacteroidia bacterium]|jgi:hypothetical protein|nr:alpha/beta hydrolase [Bacteroidia bacterium]